MIVCGHSIVKNVDGSWRIEIDKKVAYALDLFPGQVLFGASEKDSSRLFLSTIRLNPYVNYFRIFLEDFRGSMSKITQIFSDRNVNILSGGAFGFGNIWVSEFIADFKGGDATPEKTVDEIEGLGGFVSAREITELFPRAFDLQETFMVQSEKEELHLLLPGLPRGISKESEIYAVLKSWSRVQALFIEFYTSASKLLKISAKISDLPGSLNTLADLLGKQVNLIALDEQHHDEVSGEWTIYGILEIGTLDEIELNAKKTSNILSLNVEPLGW